MVFYMTFYRFPYLLNIRHELLFLLIGKIRI